MNLKALLFCTISLFAVFGCSKQEPYDYPTEYCNTWKKYCRELDLTDSFYFYSVRLLRGHKKSILLNESNIHKRVADLTFNVQDSTYRFDIDIDFSFAYDQDINDRVNLEILQTFKGSFKIKDFHTIYDDPYCPELYVNELSIEYKNDSTYFVGQLSHNCPISFITMEYKVGNDTLEFYLTH